MKSIKQILIERDGLTAEEAEEQIELARVELNNRLGEGAMPFDICEEFFGLEPDYLDELIS